MKKKMIKIFGEERVFDRTSGRNLDITSKTPGLAEVMWSPSMARPKTGQGELESSRYSRGDGSEVSKRLNLGLDEDKGRGGRNEGDGGGGEGQEKKVEVWTPHSSYHEEDSSLHEEASFASSDVRLIEETIDKADGVLKAVQTKV